MLKKTSRTVAIGCLFPIFIFFLIPIILIFSLGAGSGSGKGGWGNNIINAGGHIFAEDYVVLQGFGFTAWATGAGASLYQGTGVGHTGIDVQPTNFRDFNSEDVGVYSISDGVVEGTGSTSIGGNYVYVRMSLDKVAYYGHLKNYEVHKGQQIKKGDKLGNLGNTGQTTVYHVHFEVQTNYPNLATQDSSIYLGAEKLSEGDIIRVSDKLQTNIDVKSGKSWVGNTTDVELSGSDNIEKAWNFYKVQGFSDEATAGILGNFMHESGMNPDINEIGNGIGYGLAQWSFERRTRLENWAKENNLDVKTLTAQLKFSMYEMDSMSWVVEYKGLKDIYKATDMFQSQYERAGVVNMASRYKHAEEIYKQYKGKS